MPFEVPPASLNIREESRNAVIRLNQRMESDVTDIPAGKARRWYNSTLNEVRDWVNIGGTLRKSAAYT